MKVYPQWHEEELRTSASRGQTVKRRRGSWLLSGQISGRQRWGGVEL